MVGSKKARRNHKARAKRSQGRLNAPPSPPATPPPPEQLNRSKFIVERAPQSEGGQKRYRSLASNLPDYYLHKGWLTPGQHHAATMFEALHRAAWGSARVTSNYAAVIVDGDPPRAGNMGEHVAELNNLLRYVGKQHGAIVRAFVIEGETPARYIKRFTNENGVGIEILRQALNNVENYFSGIKLKS